MRQIATKVPQPVALTLEKVSKKLGISVSAAIRAYLTATPDLRWTLFKNFVRMERYQDCPLTRISARLPEDQDQAVADAARATGLERMRVLGTALTADVHDLEYFIRAGQEEPHDEEED